jgi:GNAT superfamily N-acetyltransferase
MSDPLDPLFALYRDTFPANERRDESDLRQALATPAYRLLTKYQQDHLLAFAILFMPPASNFALLEYLAVDPNRRGKGLGANLLLCAARQSHGRPLLAELETASNGPDAHRRQQFYSRCGFRPIDGLQYQLPLTGNPPPMELWIRQQAFASIPRSQLADWLTTIYTDVYGYPADDRRLGQMLRSMG